MPSPNTTPTRMLTANSTATILTRMATATDSLPWVVLILVLALLLVPALLVLLVMPVVGVGMMGWGMGGSVVSPVLAVVSGLVPLVLLVAVGYLAYRAFAGRGRPAGRDPAIEELRMAFARGDLSHEEFEERRDLLEREE